MSESNVQLTFVVDNKQAVKVLQAVAKLLPGLPAQFGYFIWHTKDGASMSDTITVRDSDPPVPCIAAFADVEGATVDVVATWSVDDPQVAILTEDQDDDQKVTIEPGSPGASVVHCVGRNPDGSEVELVGTFTVIAGNAVTGKLDFQAPQA